MIEMNNFLAEPEGIRYDANEAVKRVIDSGWYILGRECVAFESLWAATVGCKYGVGVANGMDAIEIGLRALNIRPGDEVITTPMTAFATVLAILRTGATPVLADIEENSGLLSIESTARCITKNTKAIILVHLYGQLRDIDKWLEFVQNTDIVLIEDCAQSHIAKWNNKTAGSFGKFSAHSFYPTKNLGALGDAGMLTTDCENVNSRARVLRNYGQSERYHHPDVGLNSRLDEIQAAVLIARYKYLLDFTEKRKYIANQYFRYIHNPIIELLAQPEQEESHVFHLFALKCQYRDELMRYLENNSVKTLIHYPIPIHHQPPCIEIKRDGQGLKNSENHALTCLSIPCHPHMNTYETEKTINLLNDFKYNNSFN